MSRETPDNQAIYDENWPEWMDMKRHGPSSRWLRALIGDLAGRHLAPERIRRVLDVGCGEGTTTAYLARLFPAAEVLGVDPSGTGIACAEANYRAPNLRFRVVGPDDDLGSAGHDLVCCFEVLEHVEDWQALATRLARASTSYLMVSFPTGRMREFERNVGHLRNFQTGEFEAFGRGIGFSPVEVRYAGFPFFSPIFRDLCDLTNSGGNRMTRGTYSFFTRRLSDAVYCSFRFFSTRRRGGDQFVGLFESDGSA